MNSYSIPNEPRFAPLRLEAEHYLKPAGFVPGERRDARLHIAVAAGNGAAEGYSIERTNQRLTIRADGPRGAAHGFHHALRLLGFGFSFFADATPKQPVLRWPAADDTLRVQPAFATRGLLPWGNLLNSINVWNFEDYARYLLTLGRWGGNFVWFHNYDFEPLAAFRDAEGKWSYGKPYPNSFNPPCGGVPGIRVGKFPHGTARHFPDARRGVWGARHAFARDSIAAAQTEFRRRVAFACRLPARRHESGASLEGGLPRAGGPA
ncbi:MAG: hypothetical protein HY360_08095 [Verrucomicrobia bacterium]|nr:hypothetical protein [Verrucomicrobiota bacterium]